MNKLMYKLNRKYVEAKIKMDDFMKREDGMETLETIILVVVAIVVASFVINILTKNFSDGKGLLDVLFSKIRDQFDQLFSTQTGTSSGS